jgi:hypothetical protein
VSLCVDLIILALSFSFFLKPRFWQEKFLSWENVKTPPSDSETFP